MQVVEHDHDRFARGHELEAAAKRPEGLLRGCRSRDPENPRDALDEALALGVVLDQGPELLAHRLRGIRLADSREASQHLGDRQQRDALAGGLAVAFDDDRLIGDVARELLREPRLAQPPGSRSP